jgi:hypothetical protein
MILGGVCNNKGQNLKVNFLQYDSIYLTKYYANDIQ